MPLQNRVTPFGEIVAHPARGLFMGNRGVLHDDEQRLGAARWRMPHWVTCVLAFKGRHRTVMSPRRYTELFFLDEAVALAAGHRPCAECRRADYNAYRHAFAAAHGLNGRAHDQAGWRPYAKEMDAVLHTARVARRTRAQIRHRRSSEDLPDGTFVALEEAPGTAFLVRGAQLLPYAFDRYGLARPRPDGAVTVLTPAPTVAVLAAGYRPRLHPSVG
jgi:hypothetical protein